MRKRIPIGAPGYVGASMVAEALNLSSFRDANEYSAWLKFTGNAPEPDDYKKMLFLAGHYAEGGLIAPLAEEAYGVKLRKEPYAYVCKEHPWLICHPDREATDKEGNEFPVEIKLVSSFSNKKWGNEDTDEVPYQYLVQCYTYFHCNVPNSDYMWLIAFCDGQLKRYIIRRNEKLENQIFDRLIDIVENRWMKGIAPAPVTASQASAKWSGESAEESVVSDSGIEDAINRLRAIKDEKASLSDEEDRLKAKVIDFMAGNKWLLSENGERLATYYRTERSTFDSKSFRKDHPELADAYTRKSESMTLKI